jgi:hypothetical protein
MNKIKFSACVVAVLLAGCSAPTLAPTAAPTQAPKPVAPTAAPTVAPTAVPTVAAPTATADHSMHAAATSAPSAAATAAPAANTNAPFDISAGDPFAVALSQYYMDTASFHDMATAISNTQKLEPAYLTTVNQTKKILAQTAWGTKLNAQAKEFVTSLGKMGDALTAKNVADATKWSGVVHDQQHALSHAIDEWIATNPTKPPVADPLNVSLAQNIMDTTGFHDMATTLASSKKIDASYASRVTRTNKVLRQVTWGSALDGDAQTFIKFTGKFADALTAKNVDDAIQVGGTVHDAQHALSHTIEDWLVKNPPKAQKASSYAIAMNQYFMDAAGFHDMATKLGETKTIDAAYQSKVDRVKKFIGQTTWSPELNDQAQTFLKSLTAFSDALSKKDAAGAIAASDMVHDQQHELSHAIDDWLAKAAK